MQLTGIHHLTAITAQVHGNAIGPRLFTHHSRGDDAWFGRAPRLTDRGDVINVDV